MFKKNIILKYESISEEYPNPIVPAKTVVPEWYKKVPRWIENEVVSKNNLNNSVKQCVPFLDALTSGYMLLLPYDLYVQNREGKPFLVWAQDVPFPPRWRERVASDQLVPIGFSSVEYTWSVPASFEIPKDYSVLITHPLNRPDLPFYTLSGIIDGGWTTYGNGNLPFYVKENFEGIIKQGTPIAQMIPFKNEKWSSVNEKGLDEKGSLNEKKRALVMSGWYKNNFWTKKEYN